MLPGKSGKEIIAKLLELSPDLKYIYISGYSDNILGQNNQLDQNINFIQKPFSKETLVKKVR